MSKYRCNFCGFSNNPRDYAMRKVGKRWYHLICLDRVANFVANNFIVEMDDKLRITHFARIKEPLPKCNIYCAANKLGLCHSPNYATCEQGGLKDA